MKYLQLILVLFVLQACTPTDKKGDSEGSTPAASTDVDITGSWETVYLKVRLNSVNGTDSAMIIEASQEEFPAKLGIQRSSGIYHDDGTYQDIYIMPSGDSALSTGVWSGKGDSVFIEQQGPDARLHKFKCELSGDTGIFTGLVDFDADGSKDDNFYGVSVLQR